MIVLDLVGAVAVLVVTVIVGMVAHELAHAVALSVFGIPYRLQFLPDRRQTGLLRAGVLGTWATVTPIALPAELSPWRLRTAAMMPLALAVPFAPVVVGVLPDPMAGGNVVLQVATIGWLACALPSPRDFSLVWYPEEAIAAYVGTPNDA